MVMFGTKDTINDHQAKQFAETLEEKINEHKVNMIITQHMTTHDLVHIECSPSDQVRYVQ